MIDTSENEIMRKLEWESIDFPLELSHIHGVFGYYHLPENSIIKIWRDSQYKLKGEILLITQDLHDIEYKDPNGALEIGQFIKDEIFEAYDIGSNKKYKLFGCCLGGYSSQISDFTNPISLSFTVELIFHELYEEISERNNDTVQTCIEWYLAGKSSLLYPRNTSKFVSSSYKKIRHTIDEDVELTSENIREFRGGGRDFFFVELDDFSFIVQKVEKSFIPEWSNAIAIEYKRDFKKVPDEETRKAISEIVGFIMGFQLLYIGFTSFDNNQSVLNRGACNPWGDNIIAKCESGFFPPLNFRNHEEWRKIEVVLNDLVPNYLRLRKDLDLKNVIWKYWISNSLAIGTNLPILSSALESLGDSYLVTNKKIIKPTKESKKKYNNLLTKYKGFCDELKEFEFGERLINKAKNPYNLGVGEKINLFLLSLNFIILKDSVEDKAIKSRNLMAHSSIGDTNDEIYKAVKLSRAYLTLFHRVFLKVIGYKGKYIDYYTLGDPEIDISKNIGEK